MIVIALLTTLAGSTPAAIGAAWRAVYISVEASHDTTCQLLPLDRWTCADLPADANGIVVIVGERAIAYRAVRAIDPSFIIRRWGRLLAIQHGSIADEELVQTTVTAWAPARSQFRPRSTRALLTADPSIDVLTVAPGAFWVAGDAGNGGRFLLVGGGGFATTRVMLSAMEAGEVDTPLVVAPAPASTLSGRVEDAQGTDIDGTDVELFELLEPRTDLTGEEILAAPLVRSALARTQADGTFAFERLGDGPFVLLVTDPFRGRGEAVAMSAREPAVIRLRPPRHARGRVLRAGLPVDGARVRLIPDPQTLAAADDVRDLAAPDLSTTADGRFAMALPPVISGALQITAADGSSVRTALPSPAGSGDLDLGNILLPDPQRVVVRLVGGDGCVVSAVGPLGLLGVTIVRQSESTDLVRWLDIPEPGRWMLNADCGSRPASVTPDVLVIGDSDTPSIVDVRVVSRR